SDGKRLIGARFEARRVWQVADGKLLWQGIHRAEHRCDEGARAGAVTPDGKTLVELVAVGCHRVRSGDVVDMFPSGYSLKAVDIESGKELAALGTTNTSPGMLAMSASGDRIAAIDSSNLTI